MDPNANLREQRKLVREMMAIHDRADVSTGEYLPADRVRCLELAYRLAELVEALDDWIKSGGFLPDSWQLAQVRS
jgi:hypothetical protein